MAKYTSVGALIWARVFQSSVAAADQRATGVAIGYGPGDVDNIYVTGYFDGTVDLTLAFKPTFETPSP